MTAPTSRFPGIVQPETRVLTQGATGVVVYGTSNLQCFAPVGEVFGSGYAAPRRTNAQCLRHCSGRSRHRLPRPGAARQTTTARVGWRAMLVPALPDGQATGHATVRHCFGGWAVRHPCSSMAMALPPGDFRASAVEGLKSISPHFSPQGRPADNCDSVSAVPCKSAAPQA